MLFGSAVGLFAVYKTGPIRKEMAMSYGIMRKPWMRFPLPLTIFLFSYHVATQVPQKLGRKAAIYPTVTHDTYTGQNDLAVSVSLTRTLSPQPTHASLHTFQRTPLRP